MVISRELRQKREAAYARACAAAEDARYRNLVIDTAAWIEAGDWSRDPDDVTRALLKRPITTAAADELERRWKKIVKRGKRLAALDICSRHKLRIQTKKLRYAAEFFAGAFPRKKSARRLDRFGSRLSTLQDALGDLNDIAVHEELSERLLEAEGGQRRRNRTRKAFAAGRLAGREEARIAPKLSEAQSAYARFAKAKPFWS
jgi:CHAD domain-containing protein